MEVPLQLLMVLAIAFGGLMAKKPEIHIIIVTSSETVIEPGAIVAVKHIKQNSTLLQSHEIILKFLIVSYPYRTASVISSLANLMLRGRLH